MRSEIACALDAALRLASDGQRCFPCFTDKRPATSHGFKDAANDCDKVRQLWARCPAPLVGVVTGEISDIDVLDIDAPRHAEAATWFTALRKWLPATRIHCTRSGGFHLVFRHQPGLAELVWHDRSQASTVELMAAISSGGPQRVAGAE